MPPVTVVVGGWGKDEDDSLLYPRLSLQEKKTWSDLSSVEVFSPSGRCNNKLRPLPAAVRSIEHSRTFSQVNRTFLEEVKQGQMPTRRSRKPLSLLH